MQDYRGYPIPNECFGTKIRDAYFETVIKTIEDEKFISQSRSEDGRKGFTRTRKISFAHLIVLLTQGLSRSIQRELNSFYQKLLNTEFSIQHVTKGAFSRCRSKLKPEAFAELNRVGLKSFYSNAPWRKFKGFRLLAIDGSTAVLPKHKSIEEEFGVKNFGPQANSPRSVARISVLYDVLNHTVLDGQIGRYETSERALARQHLGQIDPSTDLVVFDKGYPGLGLMFELQSLGINYLIRMNEGWWLEVRKMMSEDQLDKEVTFQLGAKEKELLKTYNQKDGQIRCRLIKVQLPDGGVQVYCTSVLDQQLLPYECFGELYQYRWQIEEAYKAFKCRLTLEAFSGKTALAIKQDFFAKLFTMTTTAVMLWPIDEKLKSEWEQDGRKHQHKVNKTNALAMVTEIMPQVVFKKMIRPALKALDRILLATTEIIRPKRKFKRKKITKKPPSMNYKQL